MKHRVKYNPFWRENKDRCCYFCGNTRSVKYTVDLLNVFGGRVLTVDVCNLCVLLISDEKGGSE